MRATQPAPFLEGDDEAANWQADSQENAAAVTPAVSEAWIDGKESRKRYRSSVTGDPGRFHSTAGEAVTGGGDPTAALSLLLRTGGDSTDIAPAKSTATATRTPLSEWDCYIGRVEI